MADFNARAPKRAVLSVNWDKLVRQLPPECVKEIGQKLSFAIGNNYRNLAGKLGFTVDDVEVFALDEPTNPGHQLLTTWMRRDDTTARVLKHALMEIGRTDVIHVVEKGLSEPVNLVVVVKDEEDHSILFDGVVRCFGQETVEEAIRSSDHLSNIMHELRPCSKCDVFSRRVTDFKGKQISLIRGNSQEEASRRFEHVPVQETVDKTQHVQGGNCTTHCTSTVANGRSNYQQHDQQSRNFASVASETIVKSKHTAPGFYLPEQDQTCDNLKACRPTSAELDDPDSFQAINSSMDQMSLQSYPNKVNQSASQSKLTSNSKVFSDLPNQKWNTNTAEPTNDRKNPRPAPVQAQVTQVAKFSVEDDRPHVPANSQSSSLHALEETEKMTCRTNTDRLTTGGKSRSKAGYALSVKTMSTSGAHPSGPHPQGAYPSGAHPSGAHPSVVSVGEYLSMSETGAQALRNTPTTTACGPVGLGEYLTTSEVGALRPDHLLRGYHREATNIKTISQLLVHYLHSDDCYIIRPSRDDSSKLSISVTFAKEVVNYRIHEREQLVGGCVRKEYYLLQHGPTFKSISLLIQYYKTHKILEEGETDGPRLVKAI